MGKKIPSCCGGIKPQQAHPFPLLTYFSPLAAGSMLLTTVFLAAPARQGEWVVVAGAVLSMALLYGLLFTVAWRAQNLINRQSAALDIALQTPDRLIDQRIRERTLELSTVNAALQVEVKVRRNAEEKFKHLAHHDPLTKLPNRIYLQERIDAAIQNAQSEHNQFAVLFIDLDNFKGINSTLGHTVGDELLRRVAEDLSQLVHSGDTLARLDGDDFIFLTEVSNKEHAASVAQKMLDAIHRPFHVADMELNLSATVGISLYPSDGEDGPSLIRNADTAMYRAKAAQGSPFQFHSPEITASAEERLMLDGLLRKALDNGELFLAYQPQIDLKSGERVGVEALLRWQHPTLGNIPPGRLIQAAEESGFICALGEWILRQACSQMRKWLDCGLEMPKVAINLSAKQFEEGRLADMVQAALEKNSLPAERLELEITESTLMLAYGADEILHALRKLGVQLSIAEFGTSYSSLSYLRQLPIQKLKIARHFVRELESNPDSLAVIRSITALAKTLGLATLAEGVETPGQAELLSQEGCDQVQGFLYAKPMPASELIVRWAEKGQGESIREVSALYDAKP